MTRLSSWVLKEVPFLSAQSLNLKTKIYHTSLKEIQAVLGGNKKQ